MQPKTMEKIVHHSSIAPESSGVDTILFFVSQVSFRCFWQPELQNLRVYILNPSQKRDRVPKKPRGEGEERESRRAFRGSRQIDHLAASAERCLLCTCSLLCGVCVQKGSRKKNE